MLEKNLCKSAPAKTKEHIRPLTITFAGRVPENSTVSSIYHPVSKSPLYSLTAKPAVSPGGVISKFLVCFGFAGAFLERVVVGKDRTRSEAGVSLRRLNDHFNKGSRHGTAVQKGAKLKANRAFLVRTFNMI